VADQVFLSRAQEIERQGVSRKIVADMFGLALRTYQRKVQRLEESASASGRTLWEAVIEYLGETGPVRRDHLLDRFLKLSNRQNASGLACTNQDTTRDMTPCGGFMPLTGTVFCEGSSQPRFDAIATWVAQGAPNN